MTRRALFSTLAAAVVDPERLLWVPGRKLISIPSVVTPKQWLGPFRVIAHPGLGGDSSVARVFEHFLNHQWRTDSAWRSHAEQKIALGTQNSLLDEVRAALDTREREDRQASGAGHRRGWLRAS